MTNLKENLKSFVNRLKENTCENLIWLVNLLPNIGGYPLMTKKFNVLFWLAHWGLAIYVYIMGTTVYQIYYADGYLDAINSFFNIYIFILIVITSWWWMSQKRHDLDDILELVKINNELVIASGNYLDVYRKFLKSAKVFVLLCYMFHFVNDIIIFIPSRTIGMDNFSTVSCVGLEPLSSSPNRQICMVILALQELTCVVTVASYDAILIFLFAHTTSVFLHLKEEMDGFQDIALKYDGTPKMRLFIVNWLRNIIKRHSLVLRTVEGLHNIYNASIGFCVVLYAFSLCIFFVMPLEVCLNFAPLAYHCLFLFFLYCVQGQRLTTASEKFEIAVYSCGWENLEVKEQKYVLLMLKVAQKPVVLFAACVIPIRIYTFANTMQSIYKFVTIFKV